MSQTGAGTKTTKSVISLSTGLEDAERVTVAFLVAVASAESGRPTLMFLTKEAVRIALDGFARAVACDGCPAVQDLLGRYHQAGGRYFVCPICFDARHLDADGLLDNATLGGTVPMWEWIGDEAANTFSYSGTAEISTAGQVSRSPRRTLPSARGQPRSPQNPAIVPREARTR